MQGILDIATGIVIGGAILGVFVGGIQCLAVPVRPGYDEDQMIRWLGGILILAALSVAFWLIFIRTGIVHIPT